MNVRRENLHAQGVRPRTGPRSAYHARSDAAAVRHFGPRELER
ncbi:MAG: hypothetical protein Q7U73_05675 [Rubrivivax sp.]|nr:hypothetical protein [Rubrivivax sp.]